MTFGVSSSFTFLCIEQPWALKKILGYVCVSAYSFGLFFFLPLDMLYLFNGSF